MTVRVTVTLPDEVLALLDEIAENEGVSRSDVVREASSEYVASHAADERARRREIAVEESIVWLKAVAARQPPGPSSLETLRELRGSDAEAFGRPIDPAMDDPGIP